MNFKELVTIVAIEHKISPVVAKKCLLGMANQIAQCIDNNDVLSTPYFKIISVDSPLKSSESTRNSAIKELKKKLGRIILKK